ncbi:OmpA family protein [Oligoflexus tunisiensis]|uniref:OmpA family protein n=1 Tax=Oligoflexus tunisiensis TaxID=708132 RepID=UPI00159F1F96|nr:OmpA family protein [Oligoflexus tunisiensis]
MTFRIVQLVLFCSSFVSTAALANIVGSDLQNFVPASTSVDGVTVNNALTLGQGRFGLGLFVDYATNTLPYFKEEDGTTRDREKEFNDAVTTLDLQVAYGLTNWWDISVAAPFIVGQQEGEDDEPHGFYGRKGLVGYRVGTKLRVLEVGPFAVGVVGTAAYNRVQDNPYSQRKWPSTSLELATSLNMGRWLLTANAGYRWRQGEPGETIREDLPVERFGDQVIYSAGAVVPLGSTWAVLAEVYGARNWDDFSEESPRATSINESVLGLRYDVTPEIQLHLGGGAEMQHSISSADLRAYTGIRWTIGAKETAPVPSMAPASAPTLQNVMPVSLTARPDAVIDLDDVHFGFDSFEVRDPKAAEIMQRLSELMRLHPDIDRVIVEGHTCDIGSDHYNMKLSDRRAIAVEKWLVNRYGIDAKKLHSIGWGEWQPKVANADAASRQQNRRVSFKIYFQKNQPGEKVYEARSNF